MGSLLDAICLLLVFLCLWRLADVSHRLDMNIIVVQSLQSEIDSLKKQN